MNHTNKKDISSFYYITRKNNIRSILDKGIFSHDQIEKEGLNFTKIYDKDVINIKKNKKLPNGDDLSNYSNLYFNPRNPMMYRVLLDKGEGDFSKGVKNLLILEIKQDILKNKNYQDVYIGPRNAASVDTAFLSTNEGIKKLDKKILFSDYWTNIEGGKSKIMVEVLVKEKINPAEIISIYTGDEKVQKELKGKLSNHKKINIIFDKTNFFLPNYSKELNEKIYLIQGDMFFSPAKIFTISVNTIGIMGKGLASRTKYQFPDIYFQYQDLCRSKKIAMGKPYLIKREGSLDDVLSYDSDSLKKKNSYKWFLLFPTKDHWRGDSDLKGIEKGLKYSVELSKKENLESIALPALGCGLGNLSWKIVGPLIRKYVNQMENIKFVFIYLPMEHKIEDKFLKPEFLLKDCY